MKNIFKILMCFVPFVTVIGTTIMVVTEVNNIVFNVVTLVIVDLLIKAVANAAYYGFKD